MALLGIDDEGLDKCTSPGEQKEPLRPRVSRLLKPLPLMLRLLLMLLEVLQPDGLLAHALLFPLGLLGLPVEAAVAVVLAAGTKR